MAALTPGVDREEAGGSRGRDREESWGGTGGGCGGPAGVESMDARVPRHSLHIVPLTFSLSSSPSFLPPPARLHGRRHREHLQRGCHRGGAPQQDERGPRGLRGGASSSSLSFTLASCSFLGHSPRVSCMTCASKEEDATRSSLSAPLSHPPRDGPLPSPDGDRAHHSRPGEPQADFTRRETHRRIS